MPRYKFQIFADYHQFYLHDGNFDAAVADLEDIWTKASLGRKLAVAPGLIAEGTARPMTVPVEIEIRRGPPDDDLSRWDAVTEAGILVPSGELWLTSPTVMPGERIGVAPGCYLARVYYGGLSTLTSYLEGADHYKVTLWPVFQYSVRILKVGIRQSAAVHHEVQEGDNNRKKRIRRGISAR